jgi:hypothetical protein
MSKMDHDKVVASDRYRGELAGGPLHPLFLRLWVWSIPSFRCAIRRRSLLRVVWVVTTLGAYPLWKSARCWIPPARYCGDASGSLKQRVGARSLPRLLALVEGRHRLGGSRGR